MIDLQASLPNGSTGDALVLARLPLIGRCVAFDAGDARRLPHDDLLRLSHLFVSHCHVDHFIGFDAMIRPRVCRPETMGTAGPEGFLDHAEGRLHGYDWNLTDGNHFVLVVREVLADRVRVARFDSGAGFAREPLPDEPPGEIELADVGLMATTERLDHHLVSQGWAVRAPPRVNVRSEELAAHGLPPGPWLQELKTRALGGDRGERIELPGGASMSLGEASDALLAIAPGSRIAFVTDTICDAATRPRIVRLAGDADVFACGAPFLQAEQAERARLTRHLTAAQAGEMAAEAGAKVLLLFHVSDRYGGDVLRHATEAHEAARVRVQVVTEEPWPVQEWG